MLVRSKNVSNKKKLCLCLDKDSGDQMIQCENSKCTSPWWHVSCAGLSTLSQDELDKLDFTCALCLLSNKKFKGNFTVDDAVIDAEKMAESVAKVHEDIKIIQSEMKVQLIKLKEINEVKEKDEKDFHKSVSKQLNEFKDEFKQEVEERKSYSKVLKTGIEKFEDQQKKVVARVAKEVVQETRITSYDRSLRENNIIIFGLKEESDEQESDKLFNELFNFVGMKKDGVKSSVRLGKKSEGKDRLLKVFFENITFKKTFLSSLYKLKSAPKNLESVYVQHDLSKSERDHLKTLLDEAKERNRSEPSEEFSYRVRGPPFAFKIVKVAKKAETNNKITIGCSDETSEKTNSAKKE